MPWRVFDGAALSAPDGIAVASPGVPRLGLRLDYTWLLPHVGERHEYQLIIELENKGIVKVPDFRIDVWFPKWFLAEEYGSLRPEEETATHKLVRRTNANFAGYVSGLYPGDKLTDRMIKYFVDGSKYHGFCNGKSLMEFPVTVVVVADQMAPMRVEVPIQELQEF